MTAQKGGRKSIALIDPLKLSKPHSPSGRLAVTWLYANGNKTPGDFGSPPPKAWALRWVHATPREALPVALDGGDTDCGCIHSYDLSARQSNALTQPQVWPVSRGQMARLRLWDDSTVHRFAAAVVAGASIAGLRGES